MMVWDAVIRRAYIWISSESTGKDAEIPKLGWQQRNESQDCVQLDVRRWDLDQVSVPAAKMKDCRLFVRTLRSTER